VLLQKPSCISTMSIDILRSITPQKGTQLATNWVPNFRPPSRPVVGLHCHRWTIPRAGIRAAPDHVEPRGGKSQTHVSMIQIDASDDTWRRGTSSIHSVTGGDNSRILRGHSQWRFLLPAFREVTLWSQTDHTANSQLNHLSIRPVISVSGFIE
jgi:hypothetical protein